MNTIKYMQFKEGDQSKFLHSVKNKSFMYWNELATFLGVQKSMIPFYLSEKCKLPHTSFVRLVEKSEIDCAEFSFDIVSTTTHGTGQVPNTCDNDLAWFIGILLGDGHISRCNYQVIVAFHGTLELSYMTKVNALIGRLFQKTVHERKSNSQKAVHLVLNSKAVVEFLTTFGIPAGNRINNPLNKIPETIFNNPELLKHCIRGIFDSEGGLHPRHHKAARIYISNSSPALLESIYSALLKLGYHVQLKSTCVRLGRTSDIIRFFEEIQPQNDYKLIKYNAWRKSGRVPSTSEVERYLINERKSEVSYGSGLVV